MGILFPKVLFFMSRKVIYFPLLQQWLLLNGGTLNHKQLKLHRIEAGLSQIELAFATDVSRWVISLAEQGLRELTPNEIERIETILGPITKKKSEKGIQDAGTKT